MLWVDVHVSPASTVDTYTSVKCANLSPPTNCWAPSSNSPPHPFDQKSSFARICRCVRTLAGAGGLQSSSDPQTAWKVLAQKAMVPGYQKSKLRLHMCIAQCLPQIVPSHSVNKVITLPLKRAYIIWCANTRGPNVRDQEDPVVSSLCYSRLYVHHSFPIGVAL